MDQPTIFMSQGQNKKINKGKGSEDLPKVRKVAAMVPGVPGISPSEKNAMK